MVSDEFLKLLTNRSENDELFRVGGWSYLISPGIRCKCSNRERVGCLTDVSGRSCMDTRGV